MAEEQALSEAEIATQMKEAIDNLGDEAPLVEEGEAEQEISEIEQQALDMGWNPEGVEGKRNISADEFVERKSLFDRIHKLEKQTKGSDKVIDALKKYNEQISEKAYERALNDLKQQKFQALEDGDNARVLELDDALEKARADKPRPVVEDEQEAYSPEEWNSEFQVFADKNVWYGRRADITKTADEVGLNYKNANPEVSPQELFTYVQSEIKNKYKDFFEETPQPNKVAAPGRRNAAAPVKKTIKDVPEGDRDIALTLIRTGTISEEDYLKSYFGES